MVILTVNHHTALLFSTVINSNIQLIVLSCQAVISLSVLCHKTFFTILFILKANQVNIVQHFAAKEPGMFYLEGW